MIPIRREARRVVFGMRLRAARHFRGIAEASVSGQELWTHMGNGGVDFGDLPISSARHNGPDGVALVNAGDL